MIPEHVKRFYRIVNLNCVNQLQFAQDPESGIYKVHFDGFNTVLRVSQTLWSSVDYGQPKIVLWFFCKAGHHRSYATLLMFLMWLTHVHEYTVLAKLVKERRPGVELLTWEGLARVGRTKVMPFADVIDDWVEFLNKTFEWHTTVGWSRGTRQ